MIEVDQYKFNKEKREWVNIIQYTIGAIKERRKSEKAVEAVKDQSEGSRVYLCTIIRTPIAWGMIDGICVTERVEL